YVVTYVFFFSSRRRHTRFSRDWSSDVCSSDLPEVMRGLRNGTLHLLQTKSGQHTATAVDSASSFVANGRVVGDAGRRAVTGATRSEERRVGKECISRVSACHEREQDSGRTSSL